MGILTDMGISKGYSYIIMQDTINHYNMDINNCRDKYQSQSPN